ncbi:hypothetical protein SK128_018316 [Halocaridina rubra]|uniref:Uncharacterized protein n=1 Tax=Halocaridina rubra TaxID=373956 RepID=A0AAN9A6J9_HALRR
MSRVTTVGTLGSELLAFSNVDALQDNFDPFGPARKKRKVSGKANKGKTKGKGKTKSKKAFKKKSR